MPAIHHCMNQWNVKTAVHKKTVFELATIEMCFHGRPNNGSLIMSATFCQCAKSCDNDRRLFILWPQQDLRPSNPQITYKSHTNQLQVTHTNHTQFTRKSHTNTFESMQWITLAWNAHDQCWELTPIDCYFYNLQKDDKKETKCLCGYKCFIFSYCYWIIHVMWLIVQTSSLHGSVKCEEKCQESTVYSTFKLLPSK